MRTTQQLSITLPNDMADVVKTKVKTGSTRAKARSSATACVRYSRVIAPSSPGFTTRSARRMTP